MESKPIVALAGTFYAGNHNQIQKKFKKIGITAYSKDNIKKQNISHWGVLLAGDKFFDKTAELVLTTQEQKVPILNAQWATDCFDSHNVVAIERQYLWDQDYNPTKIGLKKNDPKKGGPKNGDPDKGGPKNGGPKNGDPDKGGPKNGDPKNGDPKNGDPKNGNPKKKNKKKINQKDSDDEMPDEGSEDDSGEDDNGEDDSDEDDDDEDSPDIKKEEDDIPLPPAKGPNRAETDPVRRGWYDEVEGGPWTVTVPVHPADVFDNLPDVKKRRNYTMWIECIYSYYFVVTDPQTPIFVDLPQFRDAYLIPVNAFPGLKSEYISKGGHVMSKQDSSTFTCLLDEFDIWQVAYSGRVCLIFGIVPKRTDNDEEDDGELHSDKMRRPGVWTRSDLKMKFSARDADEFINRAFLALGHGDPGEDDNGRLKNGALKKWKKERVGSSNIEEVQKRYMLRGSSAKAESAPK